MRNAIGIALLIGLAVSIGACNSSCTITITTNPQSAPQEQVLREVPAPTQLDNPNPKEPFINPDPLLGDPPPMFNDGDNDDGHLWCGIECVPFEIRI